MRAVSFFSPLDHEPAPSPTLRPYQSAAVEAALAEFAAGRSSTLVVLPTGCGKTVAFSEVVRREVEQGRRALVLAHRSELLDQALHKLTACAVSAQIEQGGRRAAPDAPCVVASVQTLRGPRLERWAPDAFGLIVIDEAHHATADGYRSIRARFPGARVLGVTATPDRLDGQGLGVAFESCAYRYELRDAIRDGWLVPLKARRVALDGLDLSTVHTRAGDFDRAELAAAMAEEQALHGVAAPLMELSGGRPTILFAVDVAHAHALAQVLNRYEPSVARAVDGNASAEERAAVLADFRSGGFRILVNCALFTEGFDEPRISCVAVARPTKSRALYTQMVGRGTRLAPGKRDCVVLDFTGTAGRHRLVGPADVLAGRDLGDDVRSEAASRLDGQLELDDVLDHAEQEAERKRRLVPVLAVARYRAEEIDPFLGDLAAAEDAVWSNDVATDKQRDALAKLGLDDLPDGLTKGEASRWLDALNARRQQRLASLRQMRLLKRYGINAREMSFSAASFEIARIKANGWRKA